MKNKLKVHGAARFSKYTPAMKSVLTFLDKVKEHECYTVTELGSLTEMSGDYIRQKASHFLAEYRFRQGGAAWLYASPKTVKNFKEGMYDGST